MTRLVIFDLDGTLLNSVEDLANATNYALERCGFPTHGVEEYYDFAGRGIYNLFRASLPKEIPGQNIDEMVESMAGYFLPYYDEHKCDCTKPYDGIRELLSNLSRKGVQFAVASNKYQDGVEKIVAHFFPDVRFMMLLGQREGYPIKPDPEIVSQIMSADPTLSKEEVVYVGDSNVDMQTGINAGLRTIGVLWGFRSREELEAYRPSALVSTAEELEEAILSGK